MSLQQARMYLCTALLICLFGKSLAQDADSLHVFPNPFAQSATVYFEIVEADTISLRVFSMTGQVVQTFILSTVFPAGAYNFNLCGDSLADGLYLVRLDIGSSKSKAKKALKDSTAASISAERGLDEILLFPNPTYDKLNIPLAGSKSIVIYDLKGKVLKKFTTEEEIISLQELAQGQYLISISSPSTPTTSIQRIVKVE